MSAQSAGLPSGTVTFLFSDVVGSTRLWAADPEAMSAALRIHDQIFNNTTAKYGGYVFATAGDSFAVAFGRSSAAVECAEAIQMSLSDVDWGTGPVLRVRIGLHVGEAEERDGNYFGPVLNQAARVMAVAHGGQVLLTSMVRDGAAIAATDLGTHTLRDIEHPMRLHQLGTFDFPPLSTVGGGIVRLPSPRTSLVGRDDAVEAVRRLVGAHRLVTLTGVGGCGKTRLAIEVAHREVSSYPDGVWFVDLSTVADEPAVPGAFASTLGISVAADALASDEIATYLGKRDALLVVDNCEHVIDAAAELIDTLLERAPRLRIMATSRETLAVEGEFAWKVPSLGTGPDAPAVQMFIERALAAGAQLTLDEATANAITDVVAQLDGIPLAIELAAARAATMDVAEIRGLLDDRFSLLSGGVRRSRPRQATLEGAVHWSYDLLGADEQALLQLLSVFQGGFAVVDVAAVAAVSEQTARTTVAALAAKSLIDVTRDESGNLRHRLLETIRLFALARLIETGNTVVLRDRHSDHFSNDPIAVSQEWYWSRSAQDRAAREYENFRSAGAWALERGRLSAVVRIAVILTETSAPRGDDELNREWLMLPADLEPWERIKAAAALSWWLFVYGRREEAARIVDDVIVLAREHLTDSVPILVAARGVMAVALGDLTHGLDLIREGRQLARNYGPNVQAVADLLDVYVSIPMGRFEQVLEICDGVLANAPEYSSRFMFEACRAWALLRSDRLDDAVLAVEQFDPSAVQVRGGHQVVVMEAAVRAHVDGPESAARWLTARGTELAARFRSARLDLLDAFAYLAYVRGDRTRALELLAYTSIRVSPLSTWMIWNLPEFKVVLDSQRANVSSAPEQPSMKRFDAEVYDLLQDEFNRWS